MSKDKEDYKLNDFDSSMKIKDMVRRRLDKDPLRQEICKRVDEFNKCESPKEKEKIRKEVEKLDTIRRRNDIEKLR